MQNIPQKNLWDISYLYRNDEKRFVLFFDGYFFCSTPCEGVKILVSMESKSF